MNFSNNLTKNYFNLLTSLIHKSTDMLHGKESELMDLFRLCTNDKQVDLVSELLVDFVEMSDDVYSLCLKDMSDKIFSIANNYDINKCIVSAMACDHSPDSSQDVINSIKLPLGINHWPTGNYCNRVDHILKNYKFDEYHIFIVDDFVGSGQTVINRQKLLEGRFRDMNLSNSNYSIDFIIVAGMQEAIDKLKSQNINIYCSYPMRKGISGKGDSVVIAEKIQQMSDLESKLADKIGILDLKDYHLGYNLSESLFCRKNRNIPNNVFPIFWWKQYKNNNKRNTLYNRIQSGY